jgi:hypothetical protein
VECGGERGRRVGGGGWKMKLRRREEERGREIKGGESAGQNTENRFKNRFNRFLVKLQSKSAQKKVLTARNFWQSDSADCETDSADCAQTDDTEVKTGSTGFHQGKTG